MADLQAEVERLQGEVVMATDTLQDAKTELADLEAEERDAAQACRDAVHKKDMSSANLSTDFAALVRAGHDAIRMRETKKSALATEAATIATDIAKLRDLCTGLEAQASQEEAKCQERLQATHTSMTQEAARFAEIEADLLQRVDAARDAREATEESLAQEAEDLKQGLKHTTDFLAYLTGGTEEDQPKKKTRGKKRASSTAVDPFSSDDVEEFRGRMAPPPQLVASQEALAFLQARQDECSTQNILLEAQVSREESALQCCQEENEEVVKQLEQLQAETRDLSMGFAALEKTIAEAGAAMEAKKANLEKESDMLQAGIRAAEAEISELKNGYEAAEQAEVVFPADDTAQIAGFETQQNAANEEEAGFATELQAATEAGAQRIESVKNTVASTEAALDEVNTSIAEVKEEIDNINNDEDSEDEDEEMESPKRKASPKGRKAAAKKASKKRVRGDDDDSSEEAKPPSPKRGRGRPKVKKPDTDEEDDAEEEVEEEEKPKPARGRKAAKKASPRSRRR